MTNLDAFGLRTSTVTAAAFVLLSTFNLSLCSLAQESTPAAAPQSGDAALHDLAAQVRELRATIEQMRTENSQSRAEMQELRQELQETRKLLTPLVASTNANPSSGAPSNPRLQSELQLPPPVRPQPTIWAHGFNAWKNPVSCWDRGLTSNTRPRWKPPPNTGPGSPALY